MQFGSGFRDYLACPIYLYTRNSLAFLEGQSKYEGLCEREAFVAHLFGGPP